MRKEPPKGFELLCCDMQQYRDWNSAARLAPPDPQIGFCEDCLPEYAARMRDEGRCVRKEIRFFRESADTWLRGETGHKETVGVPIPNGEVYGSFSPRRYTFKNARTGKVESVEDREVT